MKYMTFCNLGSTVLKVIFPVDDDDDDSLKLSSRK